MGSESMHLSNCKICIEEKHLCRKRCIVPVTDVIDIKVCTNYRHRKNTVLNS